MSINTPPEQGQGEGYYTPLFNRFEDFLRNPTKWEEKIPPGETGDERLMRIGNQKLRLYNPWRYTTPATEDGKTLMEERRRKEQEEREMEHLKHGFWILRFNYHSAAYTTLKLKEMTRFVLDRRLADARVVWGLIDFYERVRLNQLPSWEEYETMRKIIEDALVKTK